MKTPEAPPASPSLADLTPEQRAVLMLRLRQKAARREDRTAAGAPLVPVARDRPLPLSFGQQRMWLVDRWQPGNPAYNLPFAYRTSGNLDREAMRWAFGEIVRRHEVLRTAVVLGGDEPAQEVRPAEPFPLPRVDLGALPAAVRLPEAMRLAEEEAREPFDLEQGRPFRAFLLELAPRDVAIVTVVHHIAADAWSIAIFQRELAALYAAHAAGLPSPLPELAIQYADFAVWQRERMKGELDAQLEYWKRRLAGASPRLDLPTDRPRPAFPSGRGVRRQFRVPETLLGGLQALSRRQGATLFMTLLAAFQTLLSRLAGQDDVSVGSPVAGRSREELEGLIGCFINTLVLRAELAGDPPFRALLEQVRETTLAAFAHQDVPFEQVVEAVQPEREPGRTPLFQVMFTLQNEPASDSSLPGVEFDSLPFEPGTSMFDLTLDLKEVPGRLLGGIELSLDLFDPATVERLIGHYLTLLGGVLEEPGRPVSELPLLGEAERHALLHEWNDSRGARPAPGEAPLVHRQFAAQARLRPEAPAVVWDEGSWTYGELRRRAGSLARHLRGLGVGPEVRVAVSAGRTPERVAAVLAVLESGGVFVPLDPDYPRDRLAYLIEDSRPAVLLAEERLRDRLPAGESRFVPLDGAWEGAAPQALEDSGDGLEPEHPVYVMYTSGSTGRPKGVPVSHGALARVSQGWTEEYGFGRRVRSVLQMAGFSFDVYLADLIRALANGGQLILCPAETVLDPPALAALIERLRPEFADMVPAVLRELVRHLEATGGTLGFRVLSAGADVWPMEDMERAVRLLRPGSRLVNTYGVTEASIDVTFLDCADPAHLQLGRPFTGPAVPIGRPFAGARLVVVDRGMRLVPTGVVGEMWIGGPNLAQGYFGRPELTAERFVPDPFAGEPGARAYRTGDRVRRLADGIVEFLGRVDNQIKIRGLRIEPGEVEAGLGTHPGVARSVVVAFGEGAGRRLAAFVVPADPATPPDAAALRAVLRERLPEALLPAAFEVLEALPLTPNGKVDRQELARRAADLDPAEPAAVMATMAAPRTPTEEIVAGIFAEVLGTAGSVAGIGIHDDFFDLGGHSLIATQVVARLRSAFGVEMPLRRLFEAPTVAGLAAEVAREAKVGSGPGAEIRPVPRAGQDLPLSFAQERLWFLEQLLPGIGLYNMPLAVRLAGALDAAALERSLAAVAERHEVLRTTYPAVAGQPVQRIGGLPAPELPRADLTVLPAPQREAEARRRMAELAALPFDLAAAAPWRSLLLRLAPEEHVLAVVIHHIAADGWSLEVMERDVARLYAACTGGGEPPAPLPVQYADYAVWQRERLRDEGALERQLAYWRERLAGLPPALDLAFDRPRPAVPSGRGASRGFVLAGLGAPLRALARRSGATLFMALAAGLQSLLARLSGQGDVALGTPVAGRDRVETERLIGLFVNTLVLRADLTDDPAFRQALLPRVREAALGAYAHQALPFERVVEELQPQRVLSHAPLFQVMLALQNTPPSSGTAMPGMSFAPVGIERKAAAFELGFQVFEGGDTLYGSVEYAVDLFDAATVERTLGHLATLLAGVAARPEARVSELPLLSVAERHQIAVEWQDTAAAGLPRGPWVHRAFERQAASTPDAVALVASVAGIGKVRLTFGELDRWAGRLAGKLRREGVAPGTRVGTLIERSPELAVAMLAIWKAGGVYVPLDPAWPAERRALLAEDSALSRVLEAEAVAASRDAGNAGNAGDDGKTLELAPDDPAYVLFTSGSTGRPKGVVVEHRNFAAFLAADQELTAWRADDAMAWSGPITFDASLWELWTPLLAGGCCHVLPAGPGPDLRAWAEILPRLTRVHAVPGLMRQLLDAVREAGPPYPRLRSVHTGGEAIPVELLAEMRQLFPEAELRVQYGPTETTVFSTTWTVAPGEVPARSWIGRPVLGTEIRVLDAAGGPVPVGVAGEIWIGGPGVARGYLNREAETAERFPVLDGRRFYRTGDRARWRPEGGLEFRGRADDQVKIRGFRIEPGEVEAVLSAAPGVLEAAVAVRDDLPGGRGLVAYVALDPDGSTDGLRSYLRERLPSYMVPARIVAVGRLPRNPVGKVDRRALASLDLTPEEGAAGLAGEPASGPVEELMAVLWSEVLEARRVGPHDDFFALGGHSLLAAQVIARIRAAFGVELPLRALFEAPTVAGLAARVAELLRAREEGAKPAPPLVVTPRHASVPLPLSFAQERLWFLEQLQPGTAAYHIPLAVRLRGRLDAGILAASLESVAARHEALRTRFPVEEGRPVQRVDPGWTGALALADLSGLPPDLREESARELAAAESARPFALAAESPLRACLVRLSTEGIEDHLLLLVLHHIAADGWSVGILTRELAAFYAGRGAGLPELPVQYPDFALWQRRWLEGEELERQLRFWRRHLEGHPGLLPLPLDRPRPAVQSFRGAGTARPLGAALTAALRGLSRRSGATLFMVLLAGLDALLHRLSGEPDVVVGVPSANRDRLETEGLIGLFVNTLALRVSLAGEPSFAGLLARVREAVLAGAAHQDLPFEKLVAELSPERHLAYSPIFQVLFQVQHARAVPLELPGIDARFEGTENRTAIFDLVLDIQDSGEDLWGIWLFNTDLFDRSTVERMTRQLEVLLEGAVASEGDPERRVAELPVLTEGERHQLLLEWNQPSGPEPGAAFAELFEAQAARTPDAPALVGEAGALTYAELAALAARGAAYLAQRGAGPESVVALVAERGPELIPAVLAVLKAGAAWLPLDPGQPEKRLAAILARSEAELTLAGAEAAFPSLPSFPPADPANLAYLIATSGSTGEPKLVMVERRGMLNHLRAKIADLGLTAADTVAQTAPHTFDISVWQSLAALLVGGRVRVYPDEVAHDPGRLLAAVARDEVTVLEVVPSLLAAVLEVLPEPKPELPRLRRLISTGEALPPEVARRWLAAYPEVQLINGYGPSEASDRVSHFLVESPASTVIPIGRPIPNLRLQVVESLDRGLAPLPIGVTGELGIGGVGVGRGYRGDPARTAESFVPDPAGTARGEPGARLYRTGDLARFLADGTLELLGRRDQQVKVRGFRIETGEVEAALRLAPEVREAVVALRDGRLVAYVVPRDPALFTDELAAALRAALHESLPAYMVPAAFVTLEALPLGPSGKVDRRALPAPQGAEGRLPGEPPRTPLESMLAAMWREVLADGAPAVGAHDSFFELGGDSIRGAIFVNRLQGRLGVEVPVAALFEAPTVAELAAALEARYPEAVAAAIHLDEDLSGELPFFDSSPRMAGLPRWPEAEPAPLSFAQERLWFLHQLDPDGAAYNMGESLLLSGALDIPALSRAFREVTRRHDTLRTRFEVWDGELRAWTGPAPEPVLSWVDLGGLDEERAFEEGRRLAREESLRPFDLERGPVLRAMLLGLAAEEHALLFTSHHIACDGWSLGLWAREVEALYRTFSGGQPSPLPELPARYADFAAWQRSWLRGAALEAQLAYWRERLRDAPPYLELPLDRPRPAFQTYGGALASLRLPADLADGLRSLSGRHNASLFMTLLAAFQLHLKRLSGQDDVVVGSPIAGRTRPEVEGLIGCFLNTLALRTDLSGNPTFLDLLRRVRETALGAFSYQDVPFEKLLEELRPERDTSRPSLFQVLFNMLNAPRAELDLPGVGVGRLGSGGVFAKFDLTLYVSEEAGGLTLDLVYNADLFEPERMRETLRQYRLLLEQIAASPERTLDRYALLTPEAAAVLPDPAASLLHPWPGAVQDLFADWARRTPEKTALSDRDGDWTYGELDDAVKRLACRLWAGGIRPGDRVAVYAHRSAVLAWALLGILKAGAAFTILDPIYPAPRLIDRLRMAEPRGLLHLEGAGPLPPEVAAWVEERGCPCRIVLPAGSRERATAPVAGQGVPEDVEWPAMGPYDVASIAFTSGSTGLPKGIVQTHGSMSYFLPWHQEELGFTAADRHTMLSGLAHDPLHRDTFYCLGTGATLCVPDPDRIGAPGYLAGWMKEQRVTVTNMTPAMGKLLVETGGGGPYVGAYADGAQPGGGALSREAGEGWGGGSEAPANAPSPTLPRADARERAPSALPETQLPDLRVAILAGDLLTREVVAQIRRLAPRALFLNVYGATESQRALSYHVVEEERGRRLKQTLPLGRGKKGSQLLVLTAAGLRAGIGELGEVVIRSPHLAQGYLKDEEQTRAKYGANPFTGEPGDRVYRTGDLGRYLPDGDVEAAGRADQQVKIRGFRVEPGEVEAELLRAPGVKETVVVARSAGTDGERQLVAYLVLDPHAPAEVPDLRERLRQSLPAYMVPSAWVALERLPVNPNGKIDRLALPAPEAAAQPAGRTSVPPRDEVEERLARIWEEVLGTAPVGVTDDFFDLGGHSLLAVRLMARIQTDLGRSLPLSALFQAGTVESLAALVRQEADGAASSLVLLKAGDPLRRPLFLVHPVGGEVLVYADLVRQLDPARPVYGLQATREPSRDGLASIAGLAAEYLEHVRAVQPRGPYLLAGWSLGGRIAFDMARQLDEAGEEVGFLGLIDTGIAEQDGQPPWEDEAVLRAFTQDLPSHLLADLPPGHQDPLGFLLDKVQQAGDLPAGFDPAPLRRHFLILKEHLEFVRRDSPRPFPGRMTFFAAEVPPPDAPPEPEPCHGWAALAGEAELHWIPGDHVTMMDDPAHLRVLAEKLEASLKRAEA